MSDLKKVTEKSRKKLENEKIRAELPTHNALIFLS